MSGAVKIKFVKGEISKVKRILRFITNNDLSINLPTLDGIPKGSCVHVSYHSNIMNIEYSLGYMYNRAWADLVGKELVKRFATEKAGWDCVGWCEDIKEFVGDGPVLMPFSSLWDNNAFHSLAEYINELEKTMEVEAKKLIDYAESCTKKNGNHRR